MSADRLKSLSLEDALDELGISMIEIVFEDASILLSKPFEYNEDGIEESIVLEDTEILWQGDRGILFSRRSFAQTRGALRDRTVYYFIPEADSGRRDGIRERIQGIISEEGRKVADLRKMAEYASSECLKGNVDGARLLAETARDKVVELGIYPESQFDGILAESGLALFLTDRIERYRKPPGGQKMKLHLVTSQPPEQMNKDAEIDGEGSEDIGKNL